MNPQPKQHRIIDKHYLNWLKAQPCEGCCRVKTDHLDIVPAHQTLGYGFMAGKGHDPWAVPLCSVFCHGPEHKGHKTFWAKRGPIELIILELWQRYGIDHPKRVFWGKQDFNRMIIGAVTNKWGKI